MHNLVNQLAHQLTQIKDTPVVIAYSGGVDSCVLLRVLVELKQAKAIDNPIFVCHVNHGLSKSADDWQRHAEQVCNTYEVPLVAHRLELVIENRQSLEAVAREARYKVLSAIAEQHKAVVLTGHHLDDQAETFFLALKRGAGVKGLSAMMPDVVLKDYSLRILRPLLSVSRKEIEEYAVEKQLAWVEDDSNTDVQFDRNFLRQQIIPQLTSRWPSLPSTIARSAAHCQSANELLNELAQDDLKTVGNSDGSINSESLTRLSSNRVNNLLRYWIGLRSSIMPTHMQLSEAVKQVSAQCDKSPAIKVGQLWLRRHKRNLYLTQDLVDVSSWAEEIGLSGKEGAPIPEIVLPDNLGVLMIEANSNINTDINSEASGNSKATKNIMPEHIRSETSFSVPQSCDKLSVLFSHNNPLCLPDYRQHSRKLKKLLQELDIPVWQRQRVPFIFWQDQLVAVLGYFVCQPFLPDCHPTKLSINWCTA